MQKFSPSKVSCYTMYGAKWQSAFILWQDVGIGLLGSGGYPSRRLLALWLIVLFLYSEKVAVGGAGGKVVVS